MGIVNVTPDSFSDGGRFNEVDAATRHALALVDAGATVIDIGGESTRPGAESVTEREELSRVMPVVASVRAATSALISVDTSKAGVARAALEAGVDLINDVTGGRDESLVATVAEFDAGIVLMHMRGEPRTMQVNPIYRDVIAEVGDELASGAQRAIALGVRADAILTDPGIGFGKTAAHNFALLGNLRELAHRCGFPMLVGASRKRSLAELVDDSEFARDDATLAVSVTAFAQGVAMVRVHDVASSVSAARWMESIEVAA